MDRIGVLIMIALNIVAGFLLTIVLGPAIQGVTDVEEVTLSGGQARSSRLLIF